MQKLKNSILDRMIAEQLSGKEIDFLLYISRFQDNSGRVCGVHYKDVAENMGMSCQTFYDVKASLEEKGFIRCEKTDRTDHDIIVLGNDSEACIRDGYINTNHNIFFCEEFYALKAGAKLLAMKLMEITYAGKGYFEIGVKKFYDMKEGYPKRFGVTLRVMRSWLMDLKEFFSIGIKNGKYYIEPKKAIYKKAETLGEEERLRDYNAGVILRRNRIKEEGEEKRQLDGLLKQYGKSAAEQKKSLVQLMDAAVKRSLEILNEGEKSLKKKALEIKLVHKLLRESLFGTEQQNVAEAHRLDGIPPADQTKQATEAVHGQKDRKPYAGKNKFHNFPQREYDYDELEKMLLNAPI